MLLHYVNRNTLKSIKIGITQGVNVSLKLLPRFINFTKILEFNQKAKFSVH